MLLSIDILRAGPRRFPAEPQIATAARELAEAISETTAGREAHIRFLFSTTAGLFKQYEFARGRQAGNHAWTVSKVIEPTWA